ncbi:MAG TPA: hypothetical protein VGH84_17145 [Steroidobacteraceae bacterium]|jgi:hypothetical protein
MANTTWNPADKTANVTLSLANLRATIATTNGGTRGVDALTSGKYYWENTYTTLNTNSIACGISLASGSLTSPVAGVAYVQRSTGNIFINGANTGSTLGIIGAGAVIGIAHDFTAHLIWFRVAAAGNWNGSGTANPGTAVGGLSTSAISSGPLYPYMCGAINDAMTANFGDSALSGALPAGFTAGFPTAAAASSQARVMVLA